MDMPKPRLPYTLHEKNRHGNFSWYFRRDKKSKRIRLNGEYGSEQFMADYAAASTGTPGIKKIQPVQKGSLRWLVSQWQASSDWARLRPATKKQHRNLLMSILETNGDLPYDRVDERAIIDGRERRASTPFAANNYVKTLRALFKWAMEMKFIEANPAKDVKRIAVKTDGYAPWTMEDIEAYRAHWQIGTRQRLAFEILFWTGLRRSDACNFGKQHIGRDGMVRIRMDKTGQLVSFMLPGMLESVISASPCGDLTFITNEYGKPFAIDSFGNAFSNWCRAVGVKKTAHGIRKFAASDAAQHGASEAELNALFGWRTNNQSLTYTRAVNKSALASGALLKRGGNVSSANPKNKSANPKK